MRHATSAVQLKRDAQSCTATPSERATCGGGPRAIQRGRPQDAGLLEVAEGHLRRATALDPGGADAFNNLGTLLRFAWGGRG